MISNFAICINNKSNPASLILGKVYRALPDAEAVSRNMLRVLLMRTNRSLTVISARRLCSPLLNCLKQQIGR